MNHVFSFSRVDGTPIYVEAHKVVAIASSRGYNGRCKDTKSAVYVDFSEEPFYSSESHDDVAERWKRALDPAAVPIVDYRCSWVDRSGFRCAEQGSLTHQGKWYCREHVSWAEADTARREGAAI
jgi:hypothetical protein